MTILYSKYVGSFFDSEVHPLVPDDAIEVSREYYDALRAGQDAGKLTAFDADGLPVLVDPPVLTEVELLARRKYEAQTYLESTDWYFARLVETGAPVPCDVLAKRASARQTMNEV